MDFLGEMLAGTIEVLSKKIKDMKPKKGDAKLIQDIESRLIEALKNILARLKKDLGQKTNDDTGLLREIHGAIQDMLERILDSQSPHQDELKCVLVEIHETAINICFNHYLSINKSVNKKLIKKINDAFNAVNKASMSINAKYFNNKVADFYNELDELGRTLMACRQENKFDVVKIKRLLFFIKDEKKSKLTAIKSLENKINKVLNVTTSPLTSRLQGLLLDTKSLSLSSSPTLVLASISSNNKKKSRHMGLFAGSKKQEKTAVEKMVFPKRSKLNYKKI